MSYLGQIKFRKVNYVGADISISRMQSRLIQTIPYNWQVQFVRTSMSIPLFIEESLDMLFSNAALHHMVQCEPVIKWVSRCSKPKGLFVLIEPSARNPIAKIARNFVSDFHTEGEQPLVHANVRQISEQYDLKLVYEKGLHFICGSYTYLAGILQLPDSVLYGTYKFCRFIDQLVKSPSLNYKFIQIYEKY